MIKNKSFLLIIIVSAAVLSAFLSVYFLTKEYDAEDFGIQTVKSPVDFNGNDIDDYSDFVIGARKDAENFPTSDGSYHEGGYPPDDVGVCTDVIWRAFREAGYSLKDMVDKDIAACLSDYPNVTVPDPNIDFRRVKNLRVFFDKYAVSLTLDINDIDEWQPGDVVIFKNDQHISLVSDIRNYKGHTYIIHNGGQPDREEDYLSKSEVTGHYRFDASLLPEEMLIPWN